MPPMKQTIYIFLLLILFSACGGDKGNEGFTLTVELDVPDQTYLYFRQEEHKKGITVDSVLTEKGKAVYKGVCGELSRVEISTEAGQRVLSLYVKNGDKIKLKGSVAAPYEINFSGPAEQEQIGKFRNDNHTLLQRLTDSDRNFYSHIGDTSYQEETAAYKDSLHAQVIDFALANPTSYASTVLIYDYLLSPETVETTDTLLRRLSPEAKPVSLLAKAELYISDFRKNPKGKMLPYMTFLSLIHI